MNYLIDFILAKILFRPNFDGVNREDMTLISNETNNEVTQEIEINTTDGIKLRALYTVAKTNIDISQRKCILYSHGNMGNIYGENKKEHMLRKIVSDVDILTYDYKGYGKNLGKSTERGIYEDIMNVWYHMVYNLKYEPKNIILYGYSLGCVPTLWLANEVHACNHIVIQAGFSSLEDVVKEITSSDNLQYLCKLLARHMLHKKFNNVERIKSIGNKVPITIFHSIEDDLIQFNCTNTLKKANPYVNVYKTLGSHSIPIYDEPSEKILRKILS
jgi:hypothetical protein